MDRRVQLYLKCLRRGEIPTEPLRGICGRILRGRCDADFQTLTDDPRRKFVMLIGDDGLHSLVGKSDYEKLCEIGYETDYIARKMREGNSFRLLVFVAGQQAKLATWDNVIQMVGEVYPGIRRMLGEHENELKVRPFTSIQAEAGYRFAEVDVTGPDHPRFMTYERLLAGYGSVVDLRAFLYFTVHLRELYTGDGFTKTPDGRRGLKEYMVPNLPIDQLEDPAFHELQIEFPPYSVSGE